MPDFRVEATEFNAYRLDSGWTFVQGLVRNGGTAPAGGIRVGVSLITDRDIVVGTAEAHIRPETLGPGDHAPWLAQIQKPPEFARVRVQVQAVPLTDLLQSAVTREFRLAGVAVRPPVDKAAPPTIAGEVVNVGTKPAGDVRVTAAVYDGDGKVFQVATVLVTRSELVPDEAAPFEIRPVGRGLREIPRYELFVEGRTRD
jgi:hypothetical protein